MHSSLNCNDEIKFEKDLITLVKGNNFTCVQRLHEKPNSCLMSITS